MTCNKCSAVLANKFEAKWHYEWHAKLSNALASLFAAAGHGVLTLEEATSMIEKEDL